MWCPLVSSPPPSVTASSASRAMRSTASGTCSDRTTSPAHDHHVRSGPIPTRVDPRVLTAPRVGLEPTTLRLTDACRSLIGPRDVGMRRSPGGVRVRHGAARCGQNCGHAVAAQRPAYDQGGSPLPRARRPVSSLDLRLDWLCAVLMVLGCRLRCRHHCRQAAAGDCPHGVVGPGHQLRARCRTCNDCDDQCERLASGWPLMGYGKGVEGVYLHWWRGERRENEARDGAQVRGG